MKAPDKHFLVCASFRTSGEPKGVCHKKGATDLLGYLEEELSDRELGATRVSSTGCLNICESGPVMVVYPDNKWFGNMGSEDAIDAVLDALEAGTDVPEPYVLSK